MDWTLAIEKNREALKHILAMLVAMAALGGSFSPCGRRCRGEAETDEGCSSVRPTIPRHLYRAILRLLRPAESAARRLIIVAARDIVLHPLPQRPRKSQSKPTILRSGIGTGILMPGVSASRSYPWALPLFDRARRSRRPHHAASSMPRIGFPGITAPSPLKIRSVPKPNDPLDTTRLGHRLSALSSALHDIPKHARRFASWQARLASPRTGDARPKRIGRVWPLRLGRPPGSAGRRSDEAQEVLRDTHALALYALERRDTS